MQPRKYFAYRDYYLHPIRAKRILLFAMIRQYILCLTITCEHTHTYTKADQQEV